MEHENIKIVGAKENNLKNVSVEFPRNKLVVFTGLSGSGKSSLAFDTLFAEGQRRYMESLSSYVRQFLGQMQKPDVDAIVGLSPAISIDQKTTSANPRSTVGTVTEINDYLRLLFAHIGVPHCPHCKEQISSATIDSIVSKVMAEKQGTKIMVISPIIRGEKGEHKKTIEGLIKNGYVRAKIDGVVCELDESIALEKNKKHTISAVIDRIVIKDGIDSRLAESVEQAERLSGGLIIINVDGVDNLYSTKHACPKCGFSFGEISPRLFSFNTPVGACPDCFGIGSKLEVDPEKVIKYPDRSLNDGAVAVVGFMDSGFANSYYKALSKRYGFSLDTPYRDLPKDIQDIILWGNNGEQLDVRYASRKFSGEFQSSWEGVVPNLERRHRETTSDYAKSEIEKLMIHHECQTCKGKRLKKEALSVLVGGKNIAEVSDLSIVKLLDFVNNLKLSNKDEKISQSIMKEIRARLEFLFNVGLSYLTLSRSAGTLSGGEAQRIRLATQIGSGLVGVLYILDEPSIGLHPRDTGKLIESLKGLRDLGNTIVVVEHDEETMRAADWIVDIGPKAGVHGGQVLVSGTIEDVMNCPKSYTGKYLSGEREIKIPQKRRIAKDGKFIEIVDAYQNNLKHVTAKIPLGCFTAVTGVSGSGKSSLVNEVLYPALANKVMKMNEQEGKYGEILGAEELDKIVVIDQSPIGRTPRSNPATYTGVFTAIRELFASTPDAKAKGYTASRFSFNVKGGRCEACGGDGVLKIEMHFLPDVYVSCEECHGKRYNRETLDVKYKGKTINDVLEMTVEDAVIFFENIPSIKNKIQTLFDVGLGYIKLGQPATTLSGGEAQRVKLATELSKRATGRTMYILDEPTTGLHTYDVDKLVNILQRLTNSGNTVLVIEHNLDVIKVVDYIIDIGPEGGEAGGNILVTGTPEEVMNCKKSYTGNALKNVLK